MGQKRCTRYATVSGCCLAGVSKADKVASLATNYGVVLSGADFGDFSYSPCRSIQRRLFLIPSERLVANHGLAGTRSLDVVGHSGHWSDSHVSFRCIDRIAPASVAP